MPSINDLFEGLPLRRRQVMVIGFALLINVVDGMDVQLLALSAPHILAEWGLGKAGFAPVLAAALVGIIVGAPLGGWSGDCFGRRNAAIASACLFGIGTLLVAFTRSAGELLLLRFLSGVGFGAALPNTLVLALEWSPQRQRPKVAAWLPIGSPIGGVIGATVSLWIFPVIGWRGLFLCCGTASVILALLFLMMPESPIYLIRRGRTARAGKVIARVLAIAPADAAALVDSAAAEVRLIAADPASQTAWRTLFGPYRRLLLGSCISLFAFGGMMQVMFNWLPVMMTGAGIALSQAIRGSQTVNAAAICSALVAPAIIARYGSRTGLMICAVAVQGALALLAVTLTFHSGQDVGLFSYAALVIVGCAGGSGIAITYALMGSGYPVLVRTTGIGLAATSLRVGGAGAILGGGALLGLVPGNLFPLIGALIVFIVIGIGAAVTIDRHLARGARR